jgi:protease-4
MINNNKTNSSEQQLADIAKEFVKQNKSRNRWRLFFILIFIGYF